MESYIYYLNPKMMIFSYFIDMLIKDMKALYNITKNDFYFFLLENDKLVLSKFNNSIALDSFISSILEDNNYVLCLSSDDSLLIKEISLIFSNDNLIIMN